MANFITSLSASLPQMTGGEKRTGYCLRDCLDDDYAIWFDVPVGKKNLRPDYTIFHPLLLNDNEVGIFRAFGESGRSGYANDR